MSLPVNQVVVGDCGEVMADWPGNSVDCIVTDPPYRIGFMGKSWDRALPPRRAFKQIYRVLKPGALAFILSSPRQDVLWRMLAMLEELGFELKTSALFWIYRTGFPKALDISKGIDRKLGLERESIAEKTWIQGGGTSLQLRQGEPREVIQKITLPASPEAKKWSGWKSQTGLKPALECILMVNKPRSEPTIVDNVLRWGTGAVNVDATRIPFPKDEEIWGPSIVTNIRKSQVPDGTRYGANKKGRFPANLIISNGALDTGETTKGSPVRFKNVGWRHSGNTKEKMTELQYQQAYDDEGSPYRFFDLDAWAEHHGFLDVAKPSRAERDFGLWNFDEKDANKWSSGGIGKRRREAGIGQARNIHATVKPVKLMAYLIELGCPSKGIVVDPFLGSGTTCIAAKKLRRQWIGIEINPEYAEIAEARINIQGPLDQFMEAEK